VVASRVRGDNGRHIYNVSLGRTWSPSTSPNLPHIRAIHNLPMHSKQLAHDFLHALTGNDAEKLSALVTDDFTLQVLPASAGFPALNKEQWIQTELRLSAVVPNGKVIHMLPIIRHQRIKRICISSSRNQMKSSSRTTRSFFTSVTRRFRFYVQHPKLILFIL
jgi:hypothetical protein